MSSSKPVAVITGAGRGIGKEVAIGLATDGYRVCLIARSKEQLQQVADFIIKQNKLSESEYPLIYAMDVADAQQVNHTIADIVNQTHSIDVLFNNAGILKLGTSSVSTEDFQAMIQINLVGAFNMIHAITPHMKKASRGYILNLASISGKHAGAYAGGYCASKFGLVGLNEALFYELAPFNIKVTAICPSYVATDMVAHVTSPAPEEMISPHDILTTIRYLLSLPKPATIKELIIHCNQYW